MDFSSPIDEFERKLRERFLGLWKDRRNKEGRNPIFLIEHSLATDEIAQLAPALNYSLRQHGGLNYNHKLAWLVYATEIGYSFKGLEYWDSFAEKLPNWTYFKNNDILIKWFRDFSQQYGGIEPSGSWAKRYGLISWPITNAFLPKDIQNNLAQTIFNARSDLQGIHQLPFAEIGRIASTHIYTNSRRYRHFFEDLNHAGRVVVAILSGIQHAATDIDEKTLTRIIKDMEATTSTREWLKDGQRWYAKQAQIKLAKGTNLGEKNDGNRISEKKAEQNAQEKLHSLSSTIELRLIKKGEWLPHLILPSLAGLPSLKSAIEKNEFTITCCDNSRYKGSQLTRLNPISRPIVAWPKKNAVLVNFKFPDETLGGIINILKWDDVPRSVFKCHADGTATQIRSNNLLPGEKYILVSSNKDEIKQFGAPAKVQCEAAYAVELDIADPVQLSQELALAQKGLTTKKTMTVSPVGLWPRSWDGEGYCEYLTTENIYLEIHSDYEFDVICVIIDTKPIKFIDCLGSSKVILDIGKLSAGLHAIEIFSRRNSIGTIERSDSAKRMIRLNVTNPIPWNLKLISSGLDLHVDPKEPTFDDFMEEKIDIEVLGSATRTGTLTFKLIDEKSKSPSEEIILKKLLPITITDWQAATRKYLHQQRGREFSPLANAQIIIDVEDMGLYILELPTIHQPLRWNIKGDGKNIAAMIINEHEKGEIEVQTYSFSEPHQNLQVDANDFVAGVKLTKMNGLYVCKVASECAAIITSSLKNTNVFSDLGVHFACEPRRLNQVDARWRDSFRNWHRAWPVNFMGRAKKKGIIAEFIRAAHKGHYGDKWIHLEDTMAQGSNQSWSMAEIMVAGAWMKNFAIVLHHGWKPTDDNLSQLVKFGEVVKKFIPNALDKEIEIAWNLAFNPEKIFDLNLSNEHYLSDQRFDIIARAARLIWLFGQFKRDVCQ